MSKLGLALIALCSVIAPLPRVAAQVNDSQPCLDPNEKIYSTTDNVKPPVLIKPPKDKTSDSLRGSTRLELLVNASGQVCSVHVLGTTDKALAQKIAQHISNEWKFKPATRDGKPVATRIMVNFNASH